MSRGKKYQESVKKYDKATPYQLSEAVSMVKSAAYASFDETVELACVLNVKPNQSVRDVLTFPHRFGKEVRVLVFAEGDSAESAKSAGASYVGSEDLIEKIKGGWFDFDVAVSTPNLMRSVGKLGPILGRRGLMPNPKTKTVTNEVASAVEELKQGRVEYRADKRGVVHIGVGKVSMNESVLLENIHHFLNILVGGKPSDHKGEFVKKVSICSTMGAGVQIESSSLFSGAAQ